MDVPFAEWSLADVWQAIYSDPRILKQKQDRRLHGTQYTLPIGDDVAFVSFDMMGAYPPEDGIIGAWLWFTKDGGNTVSTLDDVGPCWARSALLNPLLVNEICWPYEFTVRAGVWCIINHKTHEVKVYQDNVKYWKLEDLTPKLLDEIRVHDNLIRKYVNQIDVNQAPITNLCDGCRNGSGNHLMQHISRGEIDGYMLRSMTGYRMGDQWTGVHREHLVHVLRYLVVESLMDFRVSFAIPPPIERWIRNIPWNPGQPQVKALE